MSETARRPRRRILRRVIQTTVALLAVYGLLQLVLPSSPSVGHFRSAAARDAYVEAYEAALTTMPPPTRTFDLPTRYGTVRAYEWSPPGVAPTDPRVSVPALIVPGIASGAPMWRENLPSLIPHRRVIVLDAIGDAGLSEQTAPITTLEDQAAWLAEVVPQIAGGQVHVVAHSFGAASAAAYARLHPERVASLALLEPAFTMAYPPPSMFVWATIMILPLPQSWREYATMKVAGEEEKIDYNDPMARMIDQASVGYSRSLPTPTPLTEGQRAALTMPTYVAIADQVSLSGGEAAAATARTLPDATVKVWPNTTHSLPMQAAEPLARELAVFWTDHEG